MQWIRVFIVSFAFREFVLFLQYQQSNSCALLLLLCLRNYSLWIAVTVHYCHCFHLRDSLLGWIMRSSPLDWSALCTINLSSIEMATIVDPKTWNKLDFTLEQLQDWENTGRSCLLWLAVRFYLKIRNCFDFSLQQTRM